MFTPLLLDGARVRNALTPALAFAVVTDAMKALSAGHTMQPLRQILDIGIGNKFAIMPGSLGIGESFGTKLVSVFEDPARPGRHRHLGTVILFDGKSGHPVCFADAEEITLLRTAAASAVATDALARLDAHTLGIFGTGSQAKEHIRAIARIRPIERILIWGRSRERAAALAAEMAAETGIGAAEADGSEVGACDIVCTVTSSPTPVLHGDWLRPGAHVNLVGSSYPGPVEVDHAVVTRSRFFADSRTGVLAQGAEFLAAKAAGLVDDDHIAGEIGQVLLGTLSGRVGPNEITVYKSLGHVVQDLAATAALYKAPESKI
jgi:ornithine cyclodeaminase